MCYDKAYNVMTFPVRSYFLRKSSDVVADFSVCLKTPKGPGGSGGVEDLIGFWRALFRGFRAASTLKAPGTVGQKTLIFLRFWPFSSDGRALSKIFRKCTEAEKNPIFHAHIVAHFL